MITNINNEDEEMDGGMDGEESPDTSRVDLSPYSVLGMHQQGLNVADFIDKDDLTKIGSDVCEAYEKDMDSRSGWNDASRAWMNLFMQVKEPKSFPWDGASNVKFPVGTVAAIQLSSRMGPALNRMPYPISGRVNGFQTPDKLAAANRMGKHMSWQLTDQMPTWLDDHDTMLLAFCIMGCAFKKTYRDPMKGTNVSDLVMPDRLVFDYYAKNVEDARCATHWYYMHPQEVLQRQRMGIFRDVQIGSPDSGDDKDFESRNKVNNTERPNDAGKEYHRIFEQHTWLDLDEDGLEEPYIVTVCEQNKVVLRIEPRFIEKNITKTKEGGIGPIEADSYFTQYTFLPDPSCGNLGIGWGRILTPINETINTLINQQIDAGTLNNMGGGLMDESLKPKAGTIKRSPGKWEHVRNNGAPLANCVFPWPTTEPSQVLYMLLTMLTNWAQRITAVTDSMAGETPAANVPATTTLAMLEQGQKVFQGIYSRTYRAQQRELKKLKELNRRYMGEQEYFTVLDTKSFGNNPSGVAYRSDYERDDTDVTLTAEQTMPSEQVAMTRLRIAMEARNAGIRINPKYLSDLLVATFGLPDEAATDIIMPDEPDPAMQMKQLELQGKQQAEMMKGQLESERINTEQMRIVTDAQTKTAELEARKEQHRADTALKGQKNHIDAIETVGELQRQEEANANKSI